MPKIFAVLTLAFVVLPGCTKPDESHIFTLYLNAASDPSFRGHYATFDSFPVNDWGGEAQKKFMDWAIKDNQNNCNSTAELLQAEWNKSTAAMKDASIKNVKYWCEKGRYNK